MLIVARDLREKLWQTISHFHCHEGVYARNDKDYQPQAQSVCGTTEHCAQSDTGVLSLCVCSIVKSVI